jgi:hypothetical protein
MILECDEAFRTTMDPEGRFRGMPPLLRQINHREWRIVHPISYRCPAMHLLVEVDAGFPFDHASTPPIARWFYPPTGVRRNPYQLASPFHDWLYWVRHARTPTGALVAVDREQADLLFLECMDYLGVRWTMRRLFYRAVRSAGWAPWRRDAGQAYRQAWLKKQATYQPNHTQEQTP